MLVSMSPVSATKRNVDFFAVAILGHDRSNNEKTVTITYCSLLTYWMIFCTTLSISDFFCLGNE